MGRFLESLKKIWGYIKRRWKYFLPAIVIILLTFEGFKKNDGLGGVLIFLFVIFAFFFIAVYSLFASLFGGVQAENKAKKIMLPAFINMAFYFFFLSGIIYIPFYYLNPAYYKYQSECKKLPKPVIYNQDYWEILSNWSNLQPRPRSYIDDKGYSRAVYFSEKLNKEFSLDKKKRKENSVKTSWGWIDSVDWFYDGEHYATTVGYYYDGLVFRFGASKISFGYEYLGCDNFFKHKFREPTYEQSK